MASTVSRSSCYHKPGADGIGISEEEGKAQVLSDRNLKQPIPLKNYLTGDVTYDTLHQTAEKPMTCSQTVCTGSHIDQNQFSVEEDLERKANKFLTQFYEDHKRTDEFETRWSSVDAEIKETGTYELTHEELEYGVQLCWRNEPRCSARIQWKNLTLLDKRDVTTTQEMYQAMVEHVKLTFNGGVIKPAITVFRQRKKGIDDMRVWNPLFLMHAGYAFEASPSSREPDEDHIGEVPETKTMGDQVNLEFTRFCQRLGWKGNYSDHDILPLVFSNDGKPKLYEYPEEILESTVCKVRIVHPSLPAISGLGLQWFSVPGVSWLMAEIGGIQFPACPFSGWYSSVEILRDFLEECRYPGLMKRVADAMGLDRTNNRTLWMDRVAIELNTAILHSFAKNGVSVVDQHSASEQFMIHFKNEMRERGGCPADWVWLTPSQSGSLTPVYHQEQLHYHLSPKYLRQDLMFQTYRFEDDKRGNNCKLKSVCIAVRFMVGIFRNILKKRPVVNIFYATETGTAKRFAEKLRRLFSVSFNVTLKDMSQINYQTHISVKDSSGKLRPMEVKPEELESVKQELSGICLFIASTFGNGEAPKHGEALAEWIDVQLTKMEENQRRRMGRSSSIEASQGSSNISEKTSSLHMRMSMKEKHILGDLRYGVFALGDSSYPAFCGFGKWLDSSLNDLDGSRLLKIGLGDELGDRDAEFKKWSKSAFRQAALECNLDLSHEGTRNPEPTRTVTKWIPVTETELSEEPTSESRRHTMDLSSQHAQSVINGKLRSREWLSTKEQEKNILLRFEIPESEDQWGEQTYAPGDHLAIFPCNSDEDVKLVMDHMTNKPADDEKVVLNEYNTVDGWITVGEHSIPATLFDLLKYHLSLHKGLSLSDLRVLSGYVNVPEHKDLLLSMSKSEPSDKKWKVDEHGVIDLIKGIPSLMVDSSVLVYRLKPLRPRIYSIASSLDYTKEIEGSEGKLFVDLLITVVEYTTTGLSPLCKDTCPSKDCSVKTVNVVETKGVCSTYLAYLDIGADVSMYLRSSPSMHLPETSESKRPLLLVAAGSGLAPFRGFWQQQLFNSLHVDAESRNKIINLIENMDYQDEKSVAQVKGMIKIRSDKTERREMRLFFGCRNKGCNLLNKETELYSECLTRLNAFSREENIPKTYNHHLLREENELVYSTLVNEGGRIYICGKIAIAHSTYQALIEVNFSVNSMVGGRFEDGQKEDADQVAEDFLNFLKDKGRYNQEIFGS